MNLGPTGNFPRGKFSADDEGEIRIGVTHQDKTVIIAFGVAVKWIGLDADLALKLAETIKEHATQIKEGN